MSRRVAQQEHDAVPVERDDVEDVAPRLIGGTAPAGDVVAAHFGHRPREDPHLDVAGHGQLALYLFLDEKLREQAHALQGHGALGRERRGDLLVLGREDSVLLVEHLEDADEGVVVPDEGDRQQAAGPVAGLPVGVRVEPRVGVAVRHVHEPAGLRALSGDPAVGGKAKLARACGDGREQLAGRRVVEEDGAAVGPQESPPGVHDLREDRRQLEGGGELARDLEDALERVLVDGGLVVRSGHLP